MKITPQCVVALTWTLKDTLGDELDALDEPVEFLLGGNDLLASIEEALQGHADGDTLALTTMKTWFFSNRATFFRPSWKKA